ncbi:MAG: DUF2470 domain-containing protein [Pseudomonadota bacterium]
MSGPTIEYRTNFAEQVAPDAPLSIAKRLIRTAQRANLVFTELDTSRTSTVETTMASDVGGAVLAHIERASALYEAILENEELQIEIVDPIEGNSTILRMDCHCALLMDEAAREAAELRLEAKHGQSNGNTLIARLQPQKAELVASEVHSEIDVTELFSEPDAQMLQVERNIVAHVNSDHKDAVLGYAVGLLGKPDSDWRLVSIDVDGMDLKCSGSTCRLWFDEPLTRPEDFKNVLVKLAMRAGL